MSSGEQPRMGNPALNSSPRKLPQIGNPALNTPPRMHPSGTSTHQHLHDPGVPDLLPLVKPPRGKGSPRQEGSMRRPHLV